MSMDTHNTFKNITGGNSQVDATDLNEVLAALEAGATVLFAQGFYKLTANLTLASDVTLVFEDDLEIIGGGFELAVPEGRVNVSPAASALTLADLTISGGEMNGTLLTVMAAGSNALTFDAPSLTLKPGVGSAALAFERPLEGVRNITVEPAGNGDAVPETGPAFDLGSGFETTILSRVYQESQGEAALTGGLIDIRSDLSFQSATVTITEPREGDALSFTNDADTLAALLRVTLDYNTDTGVLSITPASGRLLNAGLVELLLESIRFENTTTKPGDSREFSYELTDKDGNTLNATAILLINDLNGAPELELNAIDDSGWAIGDVTASFAQGGSAVDITTDAAISLTDAEDDAINFVTVKIDNVYDTSLESLQLRSTAAEGDLFGLSPAALAEIAGVVVSYDVDSATLTIQASQDLLNDDIATTDLFAFLLNEVTYANTAANPVAGGGDTRTISVVAKDTLTQNPLASEPLVFTIGLEGDNLDAINAATTPAEMRAAIENDAVVSQAITDLLTETGGVYLNITSDDLRDAFLQALIDNRPEEDGYITFAEFKDDFLSPLLVVVDAGLDLLAATVAIDVSDALAKAIDNIGDLHLNSVEKSDLEAAKSVFDGLEAGGKTAFANDLAANTGDQDALAGNFLELAAALLTFRDTVQDTVTAANGDAFAISDLQAVSDELDAIKLIKSDALINGQAIDGVITDVDAQITALGDLTEVRLQALLQDLKDSADYGSYTELFNRINVVEPLRTDVQNAVNALVDAANGADTALSVDTFADVRDALQAIVDASLTTEIDGTPVEDISAGDLAAAITLFEGLSQGTQDAVLARVQEGTTYTDLSSVLDAVEPAIRAELLEQLNAATDADGVIAVLADARAIYGNDFTDFDDLQDASESFVVAVLLASKPADGFADFDAAVLAFGKAVSLADAVEIFVTAANAADLDGISVALNQAQGALDGLEVPGIDTDEVSQAVDAFNALVEGRAQALANDLKANGGDGWTVADVYGSNMLAFTAALVVFRTEVAEAVVAGNAGTLTSTQIDDIKTSLESIQSKKADATINGAAIGPIITDVAQLVTDLDALAEGRFDDLISDLAANGEYGSYTAMVTALQPLLDYRETLQVAVENGNDGTLDLSDLRAVEDALETLGTLTVNGAAANTLVGDAKAVNDRIDALVEGRFDALIADLEANGTYDSFEALAAQLEPLLQLREALQDAVVAANAGTLDADLLDAVSDKLAALDGKIVNGETVVATDVTDAQTAFNTLDARDAIIAAVNDPETDYTSFTQLAVAIQAVIDEVNATLVIEGDSGVDDTLEPTDGNEFIILGEVYRANDDGTFTAAEAKSLSIDPNVFVLKNLSDAQGGKADKFVPAPTEQFGNDTVAVSYADGFGADKLYGFTLGAADGRADTIDFSDLADGAALLDKITSVELGKNLTRFNEVFLSKEFLSVKITFENGSTVELIDFIALDFKPEGTGTPTLAVILGDGLADGGYAAVGGFEAANFLSLVSANLRFVITDVNEATTAAEMETALGALADVSDFDITLLDTLGTQQKTDLLDALIANRGDGYADVASLGAVYTPLADLYDAIDTVVKNATVEDDPLTLADLKAVETALQAVEDADLTVAGETVTVTTLGASLSQFEELRGTTQLAVLAEVEGDDLNSFGDVLAAFEPALLKVGLALLNDATVDADVLGALADINVYLSDASAAALDAVFELGDAAQDALARDFLLNRPDGGFADLDAANALLVVLEDIYSGIDAAFSADAFDLSGEGAYELTVDGTTVQLANIDSITFNDQTVRVVADGGFDTIQAAVDAAGAGDTVLVSQGTYTLTAQLNVNKGITLKGAGEGLTVIDASGVEGAYGISSAGAAANDVAFEGFTLNGPANTVETAFGLKISNLEGVSVTNVTVQGSGRSEIDLNGVTNATLTNVTANGNDGTGEPTAGVGFSITGSDNVTLTDIATDGLNAWGGVALFSGGAYNRDVSGISFEGTFTVPEDAPIYQQEKGDKTITVDKFPFDQVWEVTNDSFRETTFGDSETYTFFFGSEEDAVAYSTQEGFADRAVIRQPDGTLLVADGMSIQAAVDAADAGDTIVVGSGTYNEAVSVSTANLTIVGPNADISGTATRGAEAEITGKFTVNAGGEGLTVDGLKLAPTSTATNQVYIRGDNTTITNSVINAQMEVGIDGFTLTDSFIGGMGTSGATGVAANALYSDRASGGANWTISGNTFDDFARGLTLASSGEGVTYANLTVTDNIFQTFTHRAIQFGDNGTIDGATITGNTFKDGQAGVGIFSPVNVASVGTVTIDTNTFENLDIGVWINAPSASDIFVDQGVDGNTFTNVDQSVRYQAPITSLNVSELFGADPVNFADVALSFFEETEDSAARYEITFEGETVTVVGVGTLSFGDKTVLVVGSGGFETIQDAVDAAGAGDTVLVTAGTYDEAVTVDVEGLTITGANAGIAGNGDRDAETVVTGTLKFAADNVTIDGLEFEVSGNSRGVGPAATTGGTVTNSVFTAGDGNAATRGIQGDWYGEPANLTVSNNLFTTEFGLAGTENMSDLTVTGNVFETGTEAIGFGTGVTLADVSGNTAPEGQFVNYTADVIQLGANTVGGTEFEGVTLGTNAADTIAETPGSDELIVGQDGDDVVSFGGNFADYTVAVDDNGTITVTKGDETDTLTGVKAVKFADGFGVVDGLSIQDAIDLAAAGDTINVAAGVFDEAVNVNKAVSLVGANAGKTGFAGDRTTETVIAGQVIVSDGGAAIDGFTLSKPTDSTTDNGLNFSGWSGINLVVTGDGASISNTIVEAFGAAGGFAGSGFVKLGAAATFEGNVVKAGTDYTAGADASAVSAVWINADADDAVTVSNNHLLVSTNVTGTPNDADALFLNNAGTVVIEGNLISGTDGGIVAFGDYGTLTISDNTIETYAKTALRIFESTNDTKPDVILTGNSIDASGVSIVTIDGDVKLGTSGTGFPALSANLVGVPAIYRANDLAGDFGVFADGSFTLLADQDDAIAAAGDQGVIWSFADAQFKVFDGMSIQAAVNAADAGDTIIVGGGTYDRVTIDKGVTLTAVDGETPTINGAGVNQGSGIRVEDGVDNVSINGFTVNATAGDLAAVYIVGNNTGVTLDGNTLNGGTSTALLTGGGVNDVSLNDNSLNADGPQLAVYVNGATSRDNASTDVSLTGNTITGGADAGLLVGLESTGGTVTGNSFNGSASYAALELWGADNTVSGNTFDAFDTVILDQNGNYTVADLVADNTFVAPVIQLISTDGFGNVYNALSSALAAAQSGDVVKIAAGTLDLSGEDRLTVPAGVTLVGADPVDGDLQTTISGGLLELLDGASVSNLAFVDYDARVGGGQAVIEVSGGATVSGNTFTVDGASSAYADEIRVTGENATIADNTITRDVAGDVAGASIGNPGISVAGVGKVTVTNNTLVQAIIGVVTAADGVDLTITGNTVTPTVVSQDGIFITGPGFGAIPDGSVLNIAGNTFNANGDGVVLGLQLRGTATDAFDFAGFGTIGNDFFQGGTGNDTFLVSAGNDLLDGGDGIDTVKIVTLELAEITKSDADVLLGDDTLRNIERLETSTGQVVSLVAADGFTVLLEETDTRPALRFADGDLQGAVNAVSAAGTVTNALTLEGGDYSGPPELLFEPAFTLNATGGATLGDVIAPSLTLTGTGNVTLGRFGGTLDASGLSGALVATAAGGSSITGGSGVDVITIGAAFDAAGISEDANGVLTYTVGDSTFTLTGVETLQFNDTTVHVAGAGTNRGVQAAVDAAGPNDVVLIGNGTYAEVVTIASDKTGLKVLGSDDVTVTAFNVQANDVAIEGLTVLGGGNTSGSNAGVYVAANGVSLADLTLTGPGDGTTGGTFRGILTASAKGVDLVVDNVTASGWATGIYLNPGATDASVSGSDFSGNFVGMSIDGNGDNVTLTGNTFGGTDEDLGLGGNGIASATGNTFVSGQFGNYSGGVETLGASTVDGDAYDTIRLGQTNADDTIATDGLTTELVIGGGGLDTLEVGSGIGLPLDLIGLDGDGRTTLSFVGAETVTATLESVEQVSFVPEGGAGTFGSAPDAGDRVVFSLVADAAEFPVTVEGTGSRPALHFKAADLPAIALAAAASFGDEDVVITVQDGVDYPGDIDLTAIEGGFNANKITINREGDSDVFIGPVFAPEGKVVLGDGILFVNLAPELANAEVSAGEGEDAVEGDDLGFFLASDLLVLYKDDDVGSVLAGIAVTGIDSSGEGVLSGKWEFKEPNRNDFQDLETFFLAGLSEESALLLAQDTQLRFVADPSTEENPNFGTVPVLNFVAVDSTQPVVSDAQFTTPFFGGRVADVTTRGGATPYSDAIATYSQTVAAANVPGVFDTATFSLDSLAEDLFTQANGALDVPNETVGSSVSELFDAAFTDPDSDDDTISGVVIVANASAPELGQWQYSTNNGATWAAVGAVSGSDALFLDRTAELRFVPNWNFNGDAPALTVRSVDDTANGLNSGNSVDASAVGRGTPFGSATATVGVEVTAAADTYTFGLDAEGDGTFTFGGNPGSVFTYQEAPVISLLNFDRENGDRDTFSFSMLDSLVLGLSDRVGGANVVTSTEANLLIDNRASTALDPNDAPSVADFFQKALTSTGRADSFFGPASPGNELVFINSNSFTSSATSQGEGVGIFRDSAGVTSIWYAEEMNPFVAHFAGQEFEATLLGYLGGEDWSMDYQDDPDGNETPTVTVDELQQFLATDFSFV